MRGARPASSSGWPSLWLRKAVKQHAARAMAPGADEARQQRDQPRGVAAAAHALHAVVQADRGRLRRSVEASQFADLPGLEAAFRGRALGRPRQRALAQAGPAVDMAFDVVGVQPVVDDQLVHQRERQRAVAAGRQRQVVVALLGRLGAARIDAHERGAGALGGQRDRPEVQVRRDGVAAPDDDQPALGEMLDVHAHLGAVGGGQRVATGVGADGAVEPRGAELVEEARGHALALHHAHGAGVAVGQDGLGGARRDLAQPRGDVVQRLVPRHLHELAAALGPDALERPEHALGVLRAFGVARHLGAQRAVGGGMVGIALQPDDLVALDGDAHRAGVRTVVRAGGLDGTRGVGGKCFYKDSAHPEMMSQSCRRAP